MKDIVLKYVLKNVLEFGSVNPKAVLGQVLRTNPELKKDVPEVLKKIETAAQEASRLSAKEVKVKLEKLAPELLEEKEEEVKGPLKSLPNAEKGKVVVRIAPSPSGPLHIGHAYGGALNAAYAEMYNGKFIVRIEDTNPENIYEPAYKLIEKDVKWLTGDKVSKIFIQSERLGIYYDYAEKLVNRGRAYICTCDAGKWREMKNNGEACECRDMFVKEQQLRYAQMFSSYNEGEAGLRLKTDIKHKNPAMRDFAILRINEHVHPKIGKEQRVWPLMIFSVAIDDHEMGITHVLNGKDHADNAKKEMLIMDCFGWRHPEYKHWGRINFEGMPLSSSKTKLAIEQNEFTGWDDIRLPFLPALRKRGYQPEAFQKFASKIGLSLNDKTVSKEEFWKMIDAFNREIIEPKSNRQFFIANPFEVKVEGAPQKEIQMDLHPDFPQRGKRSLEVKDKINLAEDDYNKLIEGKIHRLIDYGNFEIEKDQLKFISEDYKEYKEAKNRGLIIHWLPVEDKLKVDVLLEDNSLLSGLGEKSMEKLKVGDIVQLERMFFARLDKIEKNKLVFWYLHR